MATYNDRVFELVRQYRYNPRLFSEEQVDQIQELATQYDIPFKRKVEEFNLRKAVSQLSSGFLEGFTTIPVGKIGGKEPKTTYEAIAHSLGHLAGFAPGIMAAPLSLGAKGLTKLGANMTAKYMQQGAAIAGKANHWSIPMMAGDFAKKGSDKLLQKAAIETLDGLKKGGGARAVLDQAVHLGAASAMSSIWKGPDEILNAGVHGAVAGGAFGGLGQMRVVGNYLKSKNVSDYRKGEQQLKGVIGAAMLGLPTALQDQPAEMIIYQTLLGGFFGYQSRPAVEVEGGKFIKDLMYSGNKDHIFYPETHPNYVDYSKGAKDYINKEATNNAKNYYRRNMESFGFDRDTVDSMIEENVKAAEGLSKNERPTQDMIDREYRSQAKDFYLTYVEGKGYKYYVHKDVADAIFDAEQKMDSSDPVELDVKKTDNLVKTKEREDTKNVFIITQDAKGNIDVVNGIDVNKIGVKGDVEGFVTGDRRVDRPADKLENTEYITFDSVFIKNDQGRVIKHKPLNYDPVTKNFKTTAQKTLANDKLWKVDVKLDQHNRYVFGGIKDKGVLTVREYHQDKDIYTKEQLFNALSTDKISPKDIEKSFNESYKAFEQYYPHVKNKDLLVEMHEKAWKSNVLVEGDRNGMYDSNNLSTLSNLMRKGFSKNVIDWNKREQLYHDKSMPLEKGTLGELPFAIFTDKNIVKMNSNAYKNNKGETEYFDSDVDGTMYMLPKDMKAMLSTLGLPSEVSMTKPVIVVKTPAGTMIVKSAARGAPKPLVKYMENNGLRAVIMTSASKHTGNLKINDFDISSLKKGEYNHIGDVLSKGTLKDTDIRINLGTFENPQGAIKKQKLVRQLSSVLSRHQAPGVMESMINEVFIPNIEGNKEFNTKVSDYLKTKDMSQLSKYMEKNKLTIDDLNTKLIHEIFTKHGNTELASKLAREMASMDRKGELEDVDTFTPEEYAQYVYRNERILDVSEFSQSQREGGLYARKFFENNYKKYMINRYYSPKYKYSAKAWMAPKDPHILHSNDIKQGEFKLDYGMKKMKVNYQGKDMTLGEAWKLSKGNNKDKAFDFLVIRVPADSMSGTRVLKFGGFTDQKGYSIITNSKDNAYLGGADKDSDSTFLYQNMPDKVINGFRKVQKEWEKPNNEWVDGKSKDLDKLFGAGDTDMYQSPASKFSPSMRRKVADTAAKGNQGLGFGIIAKNNLVALADYVQQRGGSLNNIKVMSKDGSKELGYINIKLKPGAHEQLIRLGREMVNRSADAANYPEMIDFTSFPDILLKQAFTGKYYNHKARKFLPLKYSEVVKTSLGDISRTVSGINPKRTDISWSNMQQILNNTGDLSQYSNFASFIGNRMKSDRITTEIFDTKLAENYVEMLKVAQQRISQQQNKKIVNKLNQLIPAFKLNPKNILKAPTWELVRARLEGDFHQLSSWNALNKKGFKIYNALEKMGVKNRDEFDTKILSEIAAEATRIKKFTENLRLGKQEPELPNESSSEFFDRAVQDYKNGKLNLLASKYKKNFGDNNLITREMLDTYFDLWLLSPFRQDTINTSVSKLPFQSKSVSNKSIKYLTNEHQAIFESMGKAISGEKPDKVLFDINNTPKQNVRQTVTKKFVPDNQIDFLRSRAITDKELQIVLEFEKNLDKVPMIRDNFNDFYIHWSKDAGVRTKDGPMGKDLSLIDIKDINAINKYIKDMDNRFTSKGTKLPDNAWRASIEYMDLHMQQFENKFFTSSLEKVKTSDGVVLRRVKKYTGTIGLLKDYIHKTNMSMESDLKNVPEYNIRRYPHLRLDQKTALKVNELVISKREGKDYKSMKEYKDLPDTIKIGNEKYTKDQLIEKTDKLYSEDFKQFGDQFIYAKNEKGEYMSPFENDKGHWIDIDKKHKYGKYGDFLSWGSNGKFDFESIERMLFTGVERGGNVPRIPFEVLNRYVYELGVERYVSKAKNKKSEKKLREEYRSDKNTKFHPTGRFKNEEYIPHLNYGRDKRTQVEIENYIQERLKGISDPRQRQLTELRIRTGVDRTQQEDGGRGGKLIEQLIADKTPQSDLLGHTPGSLRARTGDMPGWDRSHNLINIYKENIIRGQHKVIQSMYFRKQIENFKQSKDFNNNTKDWALYLKTYFRDSMGLPTTFLQDLPAYIKADPKFKRRAYYLTSDEAVIKWYNKDNMFKKLKRKLPGAKDIPDAPDSKLRKSDPELYKAQKDAHIEALTRLIHTYGRNEARFQLVTILGHPKIMAGNLFGGTQMTITRAGLKNFRRVNSKKWVNENLIKDLNGNYRLKFKDGNPVKTKKDLDAWLSEKGIIENFIANELQLDANLNSVKGAAGKNVKNFFKELGKKIARDPNVSDQTVADIARKYKVTKLIDSTAGWFMQKSERILRRDSFLSHAVEYMEAVGGKNALELSLNDPAVIEAGLRGVEATQFIYHSAARPAFMRTALGKTLSRFKLFVFNSVRVRKEMLRKASYYGYEPGTKEFDKFKSDFAINMFVMALGTAFTYSLFDTTLPPPYDWAQETGEWLFGDKKERDKAFFAQWPYPIAPLNIVTPPVARIPMSTFSALINKDWERFADYHAYTMFPFGRLVRSIDKTIDEPYGTTEGRALQQFLGIPLDKVRYRMEREEILRNRKDKINKELEEIYG